MKKQEFLDRLKSRINVLDDEEVADILTEYEAHINEKMNAGKTEEEAIQDFGDFNELIKDILGAYKIKDKASSAHHSEFNDWINKAVDEIIFFMKPLIDKASNLQGHQIAYFIGYILLTLLLVYLIQIPFWIGKGLGVWLLNAIPFGVGHAFGFIFSIVINIAQLVISVLIIVFGIQRAIEAATTGNTVAYGFTKKQTATKPAESKATAASFSEIKTEQVVSSQEVKATTGKHEPVILPLFGKLFLLIFKVFVFLCLLPGFMMVLGLVIVLGIMIALLTKGVYFIGLFLIVIGFLLATVTILDLIVKAVFRKKTVHA